MIGIGDKMKKIMSDKSFWLILIISIVSLVGLTVGVIFLTRQNSKEFYSAGYIINSTATRSDKYYFDDNTVYEENIFDEYVFKDKDNIEVSASKDNFIHYLDNSLSFMKNGVILDLDNFNKNIVPYYNITDKSIVQYNNGGYYIETADKTLLFGNFLGRITDNKYIVVGRDIEVKLAGNDSPVKGDYFEILFVENGIVKIENKDSSYQTLTEGTVIYVGDDIKINLGDKSIVYGDEVKLSLSEMTIDGNENIDIEPSGVVKEDEENDGSNNETDNGTGTGTSSDGVTGEGTSGGNDGTTSDEDGDGTDSDIDGDDTDGETTTILKKEVSVNLINAYANVNTISCTFQIIDTADAIDGDLTVNLVNTDTSPAKYEKPKTLVNDFIEQGIIFSELKSDSNYVMTITDESGVQYFQKSFRTSSLDLKLKRGLVTETSLSYYLDFGDNEDVQSAYISLEDMDGNFKGEHLITNGSEKPAVFDEGLEPNTKYRVTVDRVKINELGYGNFYSNTTTDVTLKGRPEINEPGATVITDDDDKTFALKLDGVVDDYDSIVSYTYEIYTCVPEDEEGVCTDTLVYSFTKTELAEEYLRVSEIKELHSNTDYKYKVVILYNDNYRYNEIESNFSGIFNVVGAPTLKFEKEVIDFNKISGTITIDDVDCTVSFEGRECNPTANNFTVYYREAGTRDDIKINNVSLDNEKQTLYFDLPGLRENTDYIFGVKANVDLKDDVGLRKDYVIGEFTLKTTSTSALEAYWTVNGYSFENPISLNTGLKSMNPEDHSIDELSTVTYRLFALDVHKTINSAVPIATYVIEGDKIKDVIDNDGFSLNSSLFEYTDSETGEVKYIENLDVLKMLSGGTLLTEYTVQVLNAKDQYGNPFTIEPTSSVRVYETPAILLLENSVELNAPSVTPIYNGDLKGGDHPSGIKYNPELGDNSVDSEGRVTGIIRGYTVSVGEGFNKKDIEEHAPITSINFFAYNSDGRQIDKKSINFLEKEEYIVYFEVMDGTDKAKGEDDVLSRGNEYTFAYNLTINEDDSDVTFPSNAPTSEPVLPLKKEPSFKLYVVNSDEDSITYRYRVFDYDKALTKVEDKYYISYSVNDGDVYTTEYVVDGSRDTFTLDNLTNASIYNIKYERAISKESNPTFVPIGNYYFDGYYDGDSYEMDYYLKYEDYDNRLQIIINDNELLNRVSAYLITLSVGNEKYQNVISQLSTCDSDNPEVKNKCVVIDYNDISSFKGKDIKVSIDAFYDTGYVGFEQASILNNYFKNLGLLDDETKSKIGFVYQTTGKEGPGKYFYVTLNGFSSLSDTPNGILGFELVPTDNFNVVWKLNTGNLVDIKENKFVPYGNISYNNVNVITTLSGNVSIVKNSIPVNPKVLDVVSLKTDDNSFKFTSIIPKVWTEVTPIINGAKMNVNLSIDPDTLKTDYIATDGKYKFYIDIYKKQDCSNLEEGEECSTDLVPAREPVEFYYDGGSSTEVVFDGLDPNTTYTYTVSADMNKNGKKVKTLLFDYNNSGYLVFKNEFTTLGKDKILSRPMYSYSSVITEDTYSERTLKFNTELKNNINFDIRYDMYDIDGNKEFTKVITNSEIINGNSKAYYLKKVSEIESATGKEFVYGPGYHRLVITAVTTDLHRELVLYDEIMNNKDGINYNFKPLNQLDIKMRNLTGTDIYGNKYDYYIKSTVTITDVDKVAKDGKFYIELKDSYHQSLCPGNEEECVVNVQVGKKDGKLNGICSFSENSMVSSCNVVNYGDYYKVDVKFSNLLPNTRYAVYVSTDTYRNNYGIKEKEEKIEIPQVQYTESDIKFSLGEPVASAISENKLLITFEGAALLNEYLVGIEYSIISSDKGLIDSGILGVTTEGASVNKLNLVNDNKFYPTQTITLKDGVVFTNDVLNTIWLTYYYKDDDGNIYRYKVGEDTSFDEQFKYIKE